MDLAKIRQKARQEQELLSPAGAPPLEVVKQGSISANESVSAPSLSAGENPGQDLTPGAEANNSGRVLQPEQADTTTGRPLPRDPFDVILAGRVAAGCETDQPPAAGENTPSVVNEFQEYLCFRVSDEIYGINIMDIKEIIKPREVTEVPRASSFVSGIISLRGIIIPIIDMLDRLGLPRETTTGRERVIVVRHAETYSGLLVDEIIQVVHINKDCFEAAPAVLEGIDRDFVNGIGRADGRMIILLNLENIADIHLY